MKRSSDTIRNVKEMPVPQPFLSSQNNTHHNANKTAHNFAVGKKAFRGL